MFIFAFFNCSNFSCYRIGLADTERRKSVICRSGILPMLFIVLIQPQKLITTNKLDLNIPNANHYCEKCSICL